jgi:hypothetical protein
VADEPSTDLVHIGTEVIRNQAVQRVLGRIVGAPAAEAGAWLGDEIRYRRFRRQIKLLTRMTEMLDEAGIPYEAIQPVDLTVLVPLLESGSLQEDDSMTDRWAALLAAAATNPDGVPPSYPEVLRQLTPREAAFLDRMYEEAGETWMESDYEPEVIAGQLGMPTDRLMVMVDSLLRQRLLKSRAPVYPSNNPGGTRVLLTALGHDFVSVCRPPMPRQ